MGFQPAGVIHGLFKSQAVCFIQDTVHAAEHLGPPLRNAGAEAVNVTGYLDLLAQRQVLDALYDGFDHGHRGQK